MLIMMQKSKKLLTTTSYYLTTIFINFFFPRLSTIPSSLMSFLFITVLGSDTFSPSIEHTALLYISSCLSTFEAARPALCKQWSGYRYFYLHQNPTSLSSVNQCICDVCLRLRITLLHLL